jgi:hypothetical protein
MKLILICGKAQHGKDTAAEFIKKNLEEKGNKVLLTHFADLLKYICKQFFGWNGEKDEAGRTLLQWVGTEKVREIFPTFWADFINDILTIFKDEWDYVIIPDCRFPNEIDSFAEFHPTTVRVERLQFESTLTEEQKQHISEIALDNYKFDYYIKSLSGIDNLKREITYWMENCNI